jgi:hypothetical protein
VEVVILGLAPRLLRRGVDGRVRREGADPEVVERFARELIKSEGTGVGSVVCEGSEVRKGTQKEKRKRTENRTVPLRVMKRPPSNHRSVSHSLLAQEGARDGLNHLLRMLCPPLLAVRADIAKWDVAVLGVRAGDPTRDKILLRQSAQVPKSGGDFD